jgi:hypothetical protein
VVLVMLFAACDSEPGSPDAAPSDPLNDAAVGDVRRMPDVRTTVDYFPTQPFCASEVAYPPVSGDGICALQVPSPDAAPVDFAKMNLILRVGGARVVVFDHVADAAACARLQAWHYDDASYPAQLVLCPEACSLAGSDPDSQVELVVGCDTRCAPADTGCASAAP